MKVPLTPLRGERVVLRPPVPDDYPVLFDWYSDPELVAPFDRYSEESWESFVASFASAEADPASLAVRYVVERQSDARLVGCVGFYAPHPVLEYWDVWYLIGEPSARGQGLATEAVRLLVTHLYRSTEVERVGATCDVENVPSERLLERLGFTREGTLSGALFHHGRWHDVRVYGTRRATWLARP